MRSIIQSFTGGGVIWLILFSRMVNHEHYEFDFIDCRITDSNTDLMYIYSFEQTFFY